MQINVSAINVIKCDGLVYFYIESSQTLTFVCTRIKCCRFCCVKCLKKENQIGQTWKEWANQPSFVCNESLQSKREQKQLIKSAKHDNTVQ